MWGAEQRKDTAPPVVQQLETLLSAPTSEFRHHAPGLPARQQEAAMTDLYTCNCGNQTWEIFESGVRCAACTTEFVVQHTPVKEFNHMVTQELEEELEDV